MNLLITGICGFAGSTLAYALQDQRRVDDTVNIFGVDNFSRPRQRNEPPRTETARHQTLSWRFARRSDLDSLPAFDWVIDAAANPSVLAGVDGKTSSRQILDHNLASTINVLELCKRHKAGFILLSTSRVYSIPKLAELPMVEKNGAFRLDAAKPLPAGVSAQGVNEEFPTVPPVSLYGASKLTSELLALEYGDTFGFPVWINRCGVLAGAGQFGRADQGIISFWINAYLRRQPLTYIGFGGHGHQSARRPASARPRAIAPETICQQ